MVKVTFNFGNGLLPDYRKIKLKRALKANRH